MMLAMVGSVGTFARITRVSHASGARRALMAQANSGSVTSVAALEREAEIAVVTARLQVLRNRQKQRHPLWYGPTYADEEEEEVAAGVDVLSPSMDDSTAHPVSPTLPHSRITE